MRQQQLLSHAHAAIAHVQKKSRSCSFLTVSELSCTTQIQMSLDKHNKLAKFSTSLMHCSFHRVCQAGKEVQKIVLHINFFLILCPICPNKREKDNYIKYIVNYLEVEDIAREETNKEEDPITQMEILDVVFILKAG